MGALTFAGDERKFDNFAIYYTPEIKEWINNEKVRKHYRKLFFKKVNMVITDIFDARKPRTGHVKIIPRCGVPLFYMRLENNEGQRILFDFDYDYDKEKKKVKFVEIFLLAVSDKTNIENQLQKSAEHKVHASAFERLGWREDDGFADKELSEISFNQIESLRRELNNQFNDKLTLDEKETGWSKERFKSRINRGTIFQLRFPTNSEEMLNEDFIIPPTLKLQGQQDILFKNKDPVFLLEGVAGTGKTTILLYKFVEDVKALIDLGIDLKGKVWFIALSERLKREIRASLNIFFPANLLQSVANCVISLDDFFKIYLKDDDHENFHEHDRMTRVDFIRIFSDVKMDIDLLWEEYRGILRGYNLESDELIISRENYTEEIGWRRGRVDIQQRNRIYNEIERRMREIQGSQRWDNLDKSRLIKKHILSGEIKKEIQLLYIDEVQDFTTSELSTILDLINQSEDFKIAMAGDLSQSVYPSSFTWQSLKENIHNQLQVNVSEEHDLNENYRSTPYLVDLANHMLKEQERYNQRIGTTKLQRPYAGENSGDLAQVFWGKSEIELLQNLVENNVPNVLCPLLVRDKQQKEWVINELLKFKDGDKISNYVETIAEFKGLEMTSILLWQPTKGSKGILDLIYHPQRGSFALAKDELKENAALLESRHIFVGVTRARFQLGIMSTNDSHFMERLCQDLDCIQKASGYEKLKTFEAGNMTSEDFVEQAKIFSDSENYKMAAGAYLEAGSGYEHLHYYYSGKYAEHQAKLDEAVMRYVDCISWRGIHEEDAKNRISRHARKAVEMGDENGTSNIRAMILTNAGPVLQPKDRARFDADIAKQRNDFKTAALKYHEAGESKASLESYNRIQDKEDRFFVSANISQSSKQIIQDYIEFRKNLLLSIGVLIADHKAEKRLMKDLSLVTNDSERVEEILGYCSLYPDFTKALDLVKKANEKDKRNLSEMVRISEVSHLINTYNKSEKDKEEEMKIERKILSIKNYDRGNEFIKITKWEHREVDEVRFRYSIKCLKYTKAITQLARLKNKVVNSDAETYKNSSFERCAVELLRAISKKSKKINKHDAYLETSKATEVFNQNDEMNYLIDCKPELTEIYILDEIKRIKLNRIDSETAVNSRTATYKRYMYGENILLNRTLPLLAMLLYWRSINNNNQHSDLAIIPFAAHFIVHSKQRIDPEFVLEYILFMFHSEYPHDSMLEVNRTWFDPRVRPNEDLKTKIAFILLSNKKQRDFDVIYWNYLPEKFRLSRLEVRMIHKGLKREGLVNSNRFEKLDSFTSPKFTKKGINGLHSDLRWLRNILQSDEFSDILLSEGGNDGTDKENTLQTKSQLADEGTARLYEQKSEMGENEPELDSVIIDSGELSESIDLDEVGEVAEDFVKELEIESDSFDFDEIPDLEINSNIDALEWHEGFENEIIGHKDYFKSADSCVRTKLEEQLEETNIARINVEKIRSLFGSINQRNWSAPFKALVATVMFEEKYQRCVDETDNIQTYCDIEKNQVREFTKEPNRFLKYEPRPPYIQILITRSMR